jgi:glycosyltransferase involved in cell wall biosynthesis
VRLLIISEQYLPNIRSGAILISDLTKALLSKNHKITLITSTQGNCPELKNLKIIRIKTFSYNRKKFILKGINQLILLFKVFFKIMMIKKNFDKIFIYSPPIFLGLVCTYFPKQKKIINIQDFFPQNAIDLGILKNKLLIFLYKKVEKIIYNLTDYILVHSPNAKTYLLGTHPSIKKKILFNYNWSKIKKINIKKNKNKKIFRFIFGGSIGPSQNLEKVFLAFKNLDKICELHVYTENLYIEDLKNKILKKKIKNIQIFKALPNDLFSKKVQESDSALITLSNKNLTPFIPGKFNFYCANKKNVTAIIHKQSDLNNIIKKNKLGFVTNFSDSQKLTVFLKKIIHFRKIYNLDTNAYNFAMNNFSVKSLVDILEKI